MNARPFRQLIPQLLAGAGLALALLPWPAAAQTAQTAKAIAEDAQRAPAIRSAPRRLEVNQPAQVTFETGHVLHMDITPDGKWLAYTRQSGGYNELWLRSLDDSHAVLPRRLAPALADRQSPALSPDGRRLAFVGAEDDVKGDIYLLDLTSPQAKAQKLTGRATEDLSPRFSPDGKTLYFQQRVEGEQVRRIVALDLAHPQAALRVLDTRGDAAHPALSPDGRNLAFVSQRSDVSAIYVQDLSGGEPRKLTSDALPQAHPRFTPDGGFVLFSIAPYHGVVADQSSTQTGIQTIIARAPAIAKTSGSAKAQALTSAQGADLSPLMAAGRLYYITARSAAGNGPANVWSLPPEGEIPDKNATDLLSLAETLANQLPVERHLTILALDKAANLAAGSAAASEQTIAAKALLSQGRQYEALGLVAAARQSFEAAAALNVEPQSGFARIRTLLLATAAESLQAMNDKGRQAALQSGLRNLGAMAAQSANSQVQAQARLEQARLLLGVGDSKALGEALRLLDVQLAVTGTAPEQSAEALFLKAETFGRIGQVQAVLPIHARVIREYPENGPWADLAVSRVLDRTVAAAGKKPENQAQALLLLSGQHRADLPKLSLGALNRLGDVFYAADEWSKAKDAYRQALDGSKDAPLATAHIATQVAAARLALAEILYREERFHQALDLYETEMASRPFEDRLYRLAKTAHLRKSTAAGDYLLRIGEVPSARAIFAGLLREDPDFVPAHRGMIRSAAALKTIPATLAEYRGKLAAKPGDATLLYATGLTLTYGNGKAPLLEGRELIRRAIQKNAQVEYFHQTLGYVDEVLETVHGEGGRLESALESYQRARFLNSREQNPENAANLDLNIGNIHFLLGQYGQAFEEYRKRQDSKVPFDNPETEILFHQRFGASAFQARERDKPALAFARSLELVESRIQPKYASEIFGRINKYVFDRVLTPALGRPGDASGVAQKANDLATRQSDLNNRLFEASIKPAGPPPDPAWDGYVKAVESLLSEQERIIGELPGLMGDDRDASMQTLFVMAGKVREALGFPPRFVQLRAELYDRLGLAHQESGRWREAREAFEKALAMNTALGLSQNLTANQRSVAYNAFMEAGLTTGQDRDRLLEAAAMGFKRIPELVKKYGVVSKKGGGRGKGLINIDLDVSLDKSTASQAAYGFSAEQEIRLAEAFLARIATELGRPREALGLVERQSSAFEKGDVAPQDAFGAALLLHRAGLLESSLGSEAAAFERFRRSAELSLEMKNPVSASLNVMDMAATQLRLPATGKDFALRHAELRRMEALAASALRSSALGGNSLSVPAFQNIMAAHSLALAERLPATDASTAALHMDALSRAGLRLSEGLGWFKTNPSTDSRRALALNTALHLNMADLALRLGEDEVRSEHLAAALALADKGLLPGLRWRALAGLGRLKEALALVQALPLDEASCGAGEITGTFAPLVAALIDAGKAEDAYNLSERLSELERVGRMGRLGVAQPTSAESLLLRRTSLRLLAIRDLKARLAVAKGDDRADLSRRLGQEVEILQRDLGQDRESLPGVARIGASLAEQDWLTILHGLSLEAAAAAEAAVGGSAEQRARHAQLLTRLAALKAEAEKSIGRLDAPGTLGLFLAAPSEAIDLMENLPKGAHALRVVNLPSPRRDALRWAALRLDADSVRILILGSDPRPVLPAAALDERRLLAFEDVSALPGQDLRAAQAVGLSGTHLVRSLKARKPFRKSLLFISTTAQAGSTNLKAFDARTVQPGAANLALAVTQAHTLVAGAPLRQTQSAPSRQDELPVRFLAFSPDKGEPVQLSGLAAIMQDVSLAVLPQVPAEDLPLVAHLLSLFGVPSVLAAQDSSDKGFTGPFLAAYAESSAAGARTQAQDMTPGKGKDTAPWLLLGDPGLNAQEAVAFAATQFARYVRSGLEDFKAGRHQQSLSLFENALRVARSSNQFNMHLPDLLSYGRESAYASEQFDKSLSFAKELALLVGKTKPDTQAHAEALMRLGLVHARLEQYAQAVPALEQAAEMLANLELAPKEIEALSNLGVVLENAIQFDRALKRFEGAAKLSQKAGAKELVAKQYMSIGRIHDLRLSQYPQAREAYGEALAIYASLGRKAEMAQAMLDIGRCARLTGSFPEAEAKYAEALKLIAPDKPGDKTQDRLRARIVIEQANNAWQQARFQQAFDLQRQVLKTAEQNGWVLEQVIARNTAGLLWWSLGDHNRAVRELDAALPLAKSLRIRKDEVATTLNNRGLVERDMGRYPLALATLGEALSIDREIRSRWAIAYDLRNIAQTYIRMGDPQKALPMLDEALGIVAATGNRINQTKILLAQGEAQLLLAAFDKAKAAFVQADELARGMGLRDSQWRALHGLARLGIAANQRPEAKALLIKAVDVIEGMRAELKVDQLKDGFIADKAVVYEDLVTLLADMGEVWESFRTAERSRARNLIDLLGNKRRAPQRKEDQALYERISSVRSRLHDQESLLASARNTNEREVYTKGVKRLQDDFRDILLELQANRPDIASQVSVNPLTLTEVQKMLEPGVALLTYYVTATELLCWTVDRERVDLTRTRLGRDALGQMVLTYRRMLQNLEPVEAHSKELYKLLLDPVLPKLSGVKILGVIPHDSLHTLAFATLSNGEASLLDRFPLFQLPSASVFKFTLERRKAERNTKVLAVGNPDLQDQSLELPFAEREVGSLAWNYPNMTALTREKATKSWISAHIAEFGIIHLATHGEFDPVNPLFSALKLVSDKKGKDGDLEAAEIFDLRITADLIVLSACQTGLGKVTSGDEVQGMNQAFLYAGTHALVSSLWRVSDISTAMLMKQFYREYQTRPKAESLRRAMLHVKNRFPHPGYWGAFTLSGDYK